MERHVLHARARGHRLGLGGLEQPLRRLVHLHAARRRLLLHRAHLTHLVAHRTEVVTPSSTTTTSSSSSSSSYSSAAAAAAAAAAPRLPHAHERLLAQLPRRDQRAVRRNGEARDVVRVAEEEALPARDWVHHHPRAGREEREQVVTAAAPAAATPAAAAHGEVGRERRPVVAAHALEHQRRRRQARRALDVGHAHPTRGGLHGGSTEAVADAARHGRARDVSDVPHTLAARVEGAAPRLGARVLNGAGVAGGDGGGVRSGGGGALSLRVVGRAAAPHRLGELVAARCRRRRCCCCCCRRCCCCRAGGGARVTVAAAAAAAAAAARRRRRIAAAPRGRLARPPRLASAAATAARLLLQLEQILHE